MLNVVEVPAGSVPSAGLGSARWLTSDWVLEAFLCTVPLKYIPDYSCVPSPYTGAVVLGFWNLKRSPLLMMRSGCFWEGWLDAYQLLPSQRRLSFCFNKLCFDFFSYLKKNKFYIYIYIYTVCCDISLWWDWETWITGKMFQDRSVYMLCVSSTWHLCTAAYSQ